MSDVENTGLLEDWYMGRGQDHPRILGRIQNHMKAGEPGNWGDSDKDLIFRIRKSLHQQFPDRYSKGDIILTNSSILVLGNPKD